MNKGNFLNEIKSHINDFGYHITIVTGNSALPKYFYTIGASKKMNFELAFAGGLLYKNEEIKIIIDSFIEEIQTGSFDTEKGIQLSNGSFKISLIDSSWASLMFDGIFDYYKSHNVAVYQILPDIEHKTLDIPDMSAEFNAENEPIWKWLTKEWTYPIDQSSIVFTDIDALFGKPILELMRWESSEWEMFTSDGTNIPTDKKRAISFGTILGIDVSLLPAMYLPVEKGLWREDDNSEWNNWG